MDSRRPLTPLDGNLLDWLAPLGIRTLVLLTKADKLARSQQLAALAEVRRRLPEAMLFSSTEGTGVEALREELRRWLLEAPSHSLE
jgi:GTP-binding protein